MIRKMEVYCRIAWLRWTVSIALVSVWAVWAGWILGIDTNNVTSDMSSRIHVQVSHGGLCGEELEESFQTVLRVSDPDTFAAGKAETLYKDASVALSSFLLEWTRRDPHEAVEWVTFQVDTDLQSRLLPSMVAVWAGTSPEAAIEFASQLESGSVQDEMYTSIASAWGRHEPELACDWVSSLGKHSNRRGAFVQLVSGWGNLEPTEAVFWLSKQPPSSEKDAAIEVLSSLLQSEYPDLAFDLSSEISDDSVRARRLEIVSRAWLQSDPESAIDKIYHSEIQEETFPRLFWVRRGFRKRSQY